MQFDMLARQVLLKRTGMTNRQLIDACLKMKRSIPVRYTSQTPAMSPVLSG